MTLPERREALLALAERCEKATGPSAKLNHEINMLGICTEPTNWGFTHSLDAAMSLVPEGWTAWELRSRWSLSGFSAEISRLNDAKEEVALTGTGKTPALALCATALKARSQTPGGEGE